MAVRSPGCDAVAGLSSVVPVIWLCALVIVLAGSAGAILWAEAGAALKTALLLYP
jgi:hypothetical protein